MLGVTRNQLSRVINAQSGISPEMAIRVEERFLAEPVAHEQQSHPPGIPQADGEHAAQPVDEPVAMLLVKMRDHLGVGPAAEGVSSGGQEFGFTKGAKSRLFLAMWNSYKAT